MKNGRKWSWTAELQDAFENLRQILRTPLVWFTLIAVIDLNSDPTLTEKLKNIARYHNDDPQMQKIKGDLKAAQPPTAD
jgi:hypothetical protein